MEANETGSTIERPTERKAPRAGVEPFLTIDEVCANYGIHRGTFYRWLANPDFEQLRELIVRLPGGRIRIPADRFRSWLERSGRRS